MLKISWALVGAFIEQLDLELSIHKYKTATLSNRCHCFEAKVQFQSCLILPLTYDTSPFRPVKYAHSHSWPVKASINTIFKISISAGSRRRSTILNPRRFNAARAPNILQKVETISLDFVRFNLVRIACLPHVIILMIVGLM